jgi:hypothetical protein
MTENITGLAKYGKYLALLMERRIVVTHDNGNEPSDWPQHHFSDVGTDDDFVRELAVDFRELLHATSIAGVDREAAETALMVLLVDGLLPAYNHLRQIENSPPHTAMITQTQQVEDFTSALWRAYKTLFPKLSMILGFDIGFLFTGSAEFEKGASIFVSAHPQHDYVVNFLRTQRATWQQGLEGFRNRFIEHRNVTRDGFADYYASGRPRALFENVWTTIEELILIFLASHLRSSTGVGIQRVTKAEQDPRHPRCFRWVGGLRS